MAAIVIGLNGRFQDLPSGYYVGVPSNNESVLSHCLIKVDRGILNSTYVVEFFFRGQPIAQRDTPYLVEGEVYSQWSSIANIFTSSVVSFHPAKRWQAKNKLHGFPVVNSTMGLVSKMEIEEADWPGNEIILSWHLISGAEAIQHARLKEWASFYDDKGLKIEPGVTVPGAYWVDWSNLSPEMRETIHLYKPTAPRERP